MRAAATLVLAIALGVTLPASAAPARRAAGEAVTLHFKGVLKGADVRSGGIAAQGRFTARGAISDAGTFTDYRTQTGSTIRIRRVTAGKQGAITFSIVIDISAGQNKGWTITSGTKEYRGLHGKGVELGGVTGSTLDITLKGKVFR